MRRIPRVNRSIDLLSSKYASTQSPSVCLGCRFQAASFSTSPSRPSPTSDEKIPITGRLRNKIWGTTEPPGAKDPYANDSLKTEEGETELVTESAGKTTKEPKLQELPKPKKHKKAKTWDDLEMVGDLQKMSLSGAKFKPFAPRTVVEDSHELIAALHQAVVDVFTLKNTGKPYSDLVRLPKKLMLDRARSAKIVPTEDGAALEYEEQGAADKVFGDVEVDAHLEDPASQAEVERNLVAKDSQRARDLVKSFDKAWLDVPLRDLDLKFALLKRVFRLTGVKFPDSQVQNLHTVRFILSKMLKKPEPTKLVGVLTRNVDLKALSNVSISPTRITKTAKSKKLGELKLINAELERKGLPVGVVRNQSNKFQIRSSR